mgnify:CR=1 FL=1
MDEDEIPEAETFELPEEESDVIEDRKSTRLNSSH